MSDSFSQSNSIFYGGDNAGDDKDCHSQTYSVVPALAPNNNIFAGGNGAGDTKDCYSQGFAVAPAVPPPNNSIFAGGNGAGDTKDCYEQGTTIVNVILNDSIFYGGDGSGDMVSCRPDTIPLEMCSAGVEIDSIVTANTACATSDDGTAKVYFSGGTGPFTFQWDDPSLQTDTTATGLLQGVYQVIVRGSDLCMAVFADTVKSNSSIVAVITGEDTICNGDSTLLVATGGTTYLWNTGSTNDSIYVSPTDDSTLIVTATTAGCFDNDTLNMIVNPTPSAVITTAQDSICYGDSTLLIASGATSFLWSTGSTNDSVYVSPIADSAFNVTVTNVFMCSDAATDTITVIPLPNISIVATFDSVCYGDSTTLTVLPGGMSYLWSTTATTQSIKVGPTYDSTLWVTVTNFFGCYDSTSYIVRVLVIGSNISGTTTICQGQSTTLTSTAGAGYIWSTGATSQAINVTPTADSTFAVTVTDIFGTHSCIDSSESVLVTVNPSVSASISATADTVCIGDSTTLTAFPAGMSGYLWSTTATTRVIKVGPTITTVYTVTATNGFGCWDSISKTITVLTTTASISGATSIYLGDSTTLTASGGTSYAWDTGDLTADVTDTKPTYDSTYMVTVTKLTGTISCTDTESVVVIVWDPSNRPAFAGGNGSGDYMDCYAQDYSIAPSFSINNSIYKGGLDDGATVDCFSQDYAIVPVMAPNNSVLKGGDDDGFAVECYEQGGATVPVPLPPATGGGGGDFGGNALTCSGLYTPMEALPIELLRFNAFILGAKVKIEWITASEINNNYFTVEKVKDQNLNGLNGPDWRTVAIVPSVGNSSSTLYYSTKDEQPYLGISYYRLKQTDFDGRYEYSQMVAVDFSLENRQGIMIYPNPTRGKTYINYSGMKNQTVNMEITNLIGAKVFEEDIVITEDEFLYELLVTEHLPQGTYYIKAILNDKIYIERLVVSQ